MDAQLTHVNERGEARMVDVGEKAVTHREAVAESTVQMRPETLRMIMDHTAPKGDVFAAARIAGIMAAKRTHELIPMCHPIALEAVQVDCEAIPPDKVHIVATARCDYKTGVEMEALTAASVAALTVYDMVKAVDRGMTIRNTQLLQKSGGKSGVYERKEDRASISMLSDIADRDPNGLCSWKFRADILTHDIDYAALSVGDVVTIEGKSYKITRIGKHCFPECKLVQAGRVCELKNHCAFAEPV